MSSLRELPALRLAVYDRRSPWLYRVEYTAPGQRPVAKTYTSEDRLETGHWIAVEGTYLVVERVKPGKHGDPYDGIALCKPAMG